MSCPRSGGGQLMTCTQADYGKFCTLRITYVARCFDELMADDASIGLPAG